MLPSWVAEAASARPAPRRRSAGFIQRTLHQTARFAEHAVFAERIARPARPGLLHTLDPRIKLLSIVGLIVVATFLHHVPSLWLLAGFIAAAAALSRVPAGALFHRLWWSVPLVFVIAALPAALNLVTPGDSLLTIYRLDEAVRLGPLQLPRELAITRQGLASAALVITRLFVGVLFAVTLTLTTRWDDLLKAAYGRATAPFVLVLTMAYRYLFVLLRTVEDMHLAKRARTILPGTLSAERRWIGRRVGALFSRSRHLTERVHSAMLARGYRGEPKALTAFHLGGAEAAWLLACAAVASLALLADRLLLAELPW